MVDWSVCGGGGDGDARSQAIQVVGEKNARGLRGRLRQMRLESADDIRRVRRVVVARLLLVLVLVVVIVS